MIWTHLSFGAVPLVVVMLALWLATALDRRRKPQHQSESLAMDRDAAFLFEGRKLVDATPEGARLLDAACNDNHWDAITSILKDRFGPIEPQVEAAADTMSLPSLLEADPSELRVEKIGQKVRLELFDPKVADLSAADMHLSHVTETELSTLQQAVQAAPNPIWKTDENGKITWFNRAYADLHQSVFPEDDPYKSVVFEGAGSGASQSDHVRYSIDLGANAPCAWFDVSAVELGSSKMFYAVNVDAAVNAEAARRSFVQTLAKTFAQLPTGLAVFDRDRQLVLFNPSIVELTGLPVEYLSKRPSVFSFFDRLRDNRIMPEPKNYGSWRERIAELVERASDGKFEETWSLTSGRTYQVHGRPHPDGAIAILFDDISEDVSMTRRFRAELEMNQAVLDALGAGVAVFSENGVMLQSNATYRALWDQPDENILNDINILDSSRDWQVQCKPSPVWGDIREYVRDHSDRAPWSALITRGDGLEMDCTISPLPNKATMVAFAIVNDVRIEQAVTESDALTNRA